MTPAEPLCLSIIVPVYNRPNEVEELLESLSKQTDRDFEMVIVEDGSTLKSDEVISRYKDQLQITYYFKENTGPGISRNYGCERATGNYFIFVDSDCIIPSHYIETVKAELNRNYADCYGGPDGARDDFNNLQKAISYSMTSFLTTGGIRGGGEKVGKFNPRSFNMGFSKEVFEKTGGFPTVKFSEAKASGEDLDLSIQIQKMGYTSRLISKAYVFHKRRTNMKQFFKQVYNFGYARITISLRHPESLKILHFAPAAFTGFAIVSVLLGIIFSPFFLLPLGFHLVLIFLDSTIKNKSISIGLLSIITSYTQLFGYGYGFSLSLFKRLIGRHHYQLLVKKN